LNYSRIYRALVQRARDRSLTGDAYTETHHIVPKAFGGDDSLANLVVLTGREHFIAHWLLHRIYRGTDTEEESKAIFAFWRMSNQGLNASDKFRVTSFAYEEARVAAATKTAQLHSQRFQDPQLRRTTAEKTKASWARMTDEDRKKRVDNLSKAQKRRFQNNPQLR